MVLWSPLSGPLGTEALGLCQLMPAKTAWLGQGWGHQVCWGAWEEGVLPRQGPLRGSPSTAIRHQNVSFSLHRFVCGPRGPCPAQTPVQEVGSCFGGPGVNCGIPCLGSRAGLCGPQSTVRPKWRLRRHSEPAAPQGGLGTLSYSWVTRTKEGLGLFWAGSLSSHTLHRPSARRVNRVPPLAINKTYVPRV